MKNTLISLLLLSAVYPSILIAISPQWNSGYLKRIYIDTSDIVLKLGHADNGPCGSDLYHIQRSNVNFNEFYSMALAAVTTNKSISIKTVKCSGNRNIISTGYINNTYNKINNN